MNMLSPPVVAGLIAVLLLVPPAVWALIRQHRHWRQAERAASAAIHTRAALQAALETAPEGYFSWFYTPIAEDALDAEALPTFREGGYGSRRLAVLLDLFRGMEAIFDDVVEGFDRPSQDALRAAVHGLRDGGAGF